jgi:hypothetical protein
MAKELFERVGGQVFGWIIAGGQGRMIYCFDTSGLNRLRDDPDNDSIVRGILATNPVPLVTQVEGSRSSP